MPMSDTVAAASRERECDGHRRRWSVAWSPL